ncbi:uncharacterized protein LOC115451310 [Manduca sexta]|uniref:uncharacterized protein LOC115451310 n=1 Tax=Manduca sexta TaxID=7130 RepID=UPI00188FA567|nr:uncharacterized protein LOC115451310 [Manduca sexta]
MSTFGEIVEPSSRNVWEDWDETNEDINIVQLHWKRENEPNHIGTLIILEGKYLFDSLKQSENMDMVNSVTGIHMDLYRIKASSDYVCVLKDYDLVLSSQIVDLMKTYITVSDEVIAILIKPLATYHSSGDQLQDCIIRRLSTKADSTSMLMNYLKLEQPNIISGVSAGAICLREVLNLPGSAVVFYMEQLENNEVNELYKLLRNLNILVGKQKYNSILSSNLYV